MSTQVHGWQTRRPQAGRALRFVVASILLPISLHVAACGKAEAAPIFFETFDNGNLPGPVQDPGAQFQTGLDLNAFGDVLGWTEQGHATVHAVDRIAGAGTDFAVMIWSSNNLPGENIITLTAGIGANNLGIAYAVDFEVSPAVYIDGNQTTTANDSLQIEILRGDNSVLANHNSFPGAWAGVLAFIDDGFTYIGDGTGPVRIRVSSTNPGNNNFAGAIDNLRVDVVPEPTSLAIWSLVGLGGAVYGWRRRRQESASGLAIS